MNDRLIGVVVHPRRPLDRALASVHGWAEEQGRRIGQIPVDGQDRRVAEAVRAEDCGLLLAMGGDGTVLAALHAAAPAGVPVLGVACGSLGALTSVKAPDVATALGRFASGDWEGRALPAISVSRDGEELGMAFNDLVVVRNGAGQVILDVQVDGATFARIAGDGVVVATPLGSSAYTLAARGPLLASTADVVVVTPLAPHGGSVPPVVLSSDSAIAIGVDGGWSGARIELDGRVTGGEPEPGEAEAFELVLDVRPAAATLIDLDGETLIAGLRRRGVIADSPRLRARDARLTSTAVEGSA
jgi:NAD+ kinase